MSEALSPWRKPTAHHDPGKILLDLALSPAVGGDCLADIAALREQPALFGPVASDATVPRLIAATLVTSHSEKEKTAANCGAGLRFLSSVSIRRPR